jgi:hypothetical protein
MRILVAVTEESGPFLMKTLLGRTFSGDDEFRVVTVFDNGSIPYAKAKDGVPLFITERAAGQRVQEFAGAGSNAA